MLEHGGRYLVQTDIATAVRFEAGLSNTVGLAILSKSLDFVLENVGDAAQKLDALRCRAISKLESKEAVEIRGNAPHFFSIRHPFAKEMHDFLVARKVFVDFRQGGVRVSFGLYNSAADVDRLVEEVDAFLRNKPLI